MAFSTLASDWTLFTAETTSAGHAPSKEGMLAPQAAHPNRSSQAIIAQLPFCPPSPLDPITTGPQAIETLPVSGGAAEQSRQVEARCREIVERGNVPVCLGGDHLIKFGCLAAAKADPDRLGIIYLDAHPDTMTVDEIRYESVVHHALRDNVLDPRAFLLVGLRQFNAAGLAGIRRHGPSILSGRDFAEHRIEHLRERAGEALSGCDRIYVSIDPDGFDPAEVRAVEQPFPGGPTIDQFLLLIEDLLRGRTLAGLDISEHVPRLDDDCLTALGLAKLLSAIATITNAWTGSR